MARRVQKKGGPSEGTHPFERNEENGEGRVRDRRGLKIQKGELT